MTDRLAVILALIILLLIGLDILINSGNALIFLMRKLGDLINYIKFWD